MLSRTAIAFVIGLTAGIVVLALFSFRTYPTKDTVHNDIAKWPTTQILSEQITDPKAPPCLMGMLKCWGAVRTSHTVSGRHA